MLQIRKDICLGCGLCAQNCPLGAIYVFGGQAEIDQSKCNSCALCMEVCPQGAIFEKVVISHRALSEEIQALKKRTEAVLVRIGKASSGLKDI